jgi:phage-related minor tail protein
MGHAVSKNNKSHVNKNWSKLKCSPIGPFLQMLGIGPGNANDTATKCKSSAFSSQFGSSMKDHANVSKKLTGSLGGIQNMMKKFRTIIASIQQKAFEDLSKIATQIFTIYVKIGNIFYVIIKNLINIMGIFKATVNLGASITKLVIAFINLIRVPINGLLDFMDFFGR